MDFMKLHKHDPNKDYSGWLMQQKYDGVFAAIQRSTGKVFSRTGKEFFIPQDSKLAEHLQFLSKQYENIDNPEDYIIAEVVATDLTLEELSGLLNPNRKQEWDVAAKQANWHLYLHDWVQLDVDAFCGQPYFMRLQTLKDGIQESAGISVVVTWELQGSKANCDQFIDTISSSLIAAGAEGVVLKDPLGVYQKGKRSKQQLKLVREYTEDVRILTAEYGKGKRSKQLARFLVQSIDNPATQFYSDLGSGWTDSKREELTAAYEANPSAVLGTVWVCKGLQKSSTGTAVRLPKLMYQRYDKE